MKDLSSLFSTSEIESKMMAANSPTAVVSGSNPELSSGNQQKNCLGLTPPPQTKKKRFGAVDTSHSKVHNLGFLLLALSHIFLETPTNGTDPTNGSPIIFTDLHQNHFGQVLCDESSSTEALGQSS